MAAKPVIAQFFKENKPIKKYATDAQTGQQYQLVPEAGWDMVVSWLTVIYSLGVLFFFLLLLFDVYLRLNWLLLAIHSELVIGIDGVNSTDAPPLVRSVAFIAIGGGLGGVINNIRSFIVWHSERAAFGRRFFWRHIAQPWIGMTLALFVYALTRGGIVALGGSLSEAPAPGSNATLFATAVLAGYGAQKVFIWLDAQVNQIFRTSTTEKVLVPNLVGQQRENAADLLKSLNLKLGEIREEEAQDTPQGQVISQSLEADSMVAAGSEIELVVAK